MPSSKTLSDIAASNQLKISIDVITPNQAWTRQVRGTYHLLYPWMIGDFVHLEDFKQWLKLYEQHIHGNGNNGSPTTKALSPSPYTTARANALLLPSDVLGKIRRGLTSAISTVSQLNFFNKREL